MNILITGAAGFVGKNLTAALECIRDGRDKTHPGLTVGELYLYDIDSDPALLETACQKADFVDLANDLLDKGFIIMSSTPCDGKWNTGYAISQLGLDAIESRSKKDFLEFWKATCSGITSGVVEALPR